MSTTMPAQRRLIVGISGASGVVYGLRTLQLLRNAGVETHLVMSKTAELTFAYETDLKIAEVRELANVIQRAFLLAEDDSLMLTDDALGPAEAHCSGGDLPGSQITGSYRLARKRVIADFERRFVTRALAESGGNVSLAAKRAGKERRSFGRLLKKHGIARTDYATTT